MKLYLPTRTLPVLFLFCLIGLTLHFLPTLGIPSPDVITFYRLWAAPTDNAQLMDAIPIKWKQMHNVPSALLPLFFQHWHPYTGRFDILTISYFWGMARLFNDNGDIWRLAGTLFVSLAIGFHYLVVIKLRVSRVVAWFLSVSLFFTPIGWARGIEAETRAVFFLFFAIYLAIISGRRWSSILSALAMVCAVLTKETFVAAWILIPVMILFRERANTDLWRNSTLTSLLHQLLAHFVAGALILVFLVYVRSSTPVLADYVFQPSVAGPSLSEFVSESIQAVQANLTFSYVLDWDKVILMLMVAAGCFWLLRRDVFARWFKKWDSRFVLVVIGIIAALILYAFPFFVTSRSIQGRYIAPVEFFVTILIGMIVTPFFRLSLIILRKCLSKWNFIRRHEALDFVANGLIFFLTSIAIARPLQANLVEALQYRVDMVAWQSLNDSVIKTAPVGSHVVAYFPAPSMGEIDALLMNALLRGRYDIIYHIGDFPASSCLEMQEYCRAYTEFNALQAPLPIQGSVPLTTVIVSRSDRSDQPDLPSAPFKMIKNLLCILGDRLNSRCLEGYLPYIEYTLSFQ